MIPPRVPEADETHGAINDDKQLDMEAYSRFARRWMGMEYHQIVKRLVDLPQNAHVLEIGPGPGWIGIELALKRPDLEIVGLELSSDMRRVATINAKNRNVNITYVSGDAANMPFESSSFDVIFSNGSLHHWLNPVAVFNEIARVLRPNGKLLVSDGRRDLAFGPRLFQQGFSLLFLLDYTVPGRIMRRGWQTSIAAGYTPDELKEMVGKSKLPSCLVEAGGLSLSVKLGIV